MRPDVVAGSSIILMSAFVFYLTTTFRNVPEALAQNVPPTFFPRLVVGILCLFSLALIFNKADRKAPLNTPISSTTYITAIIFVIAITLIPVLGMMSTVALTIITLTVYWGERHLIRVTMLAVGLPLFLYLIFVLGLSMRFPQGALF